MSERSSEPMSESMQMYLVTIARERVDDQPLPLSRLAETLSISPVSVNEMCRKLQDIGLVTYRPYVGVSLTEEGEQRACYILRRHRLWEVFLVSKLGFSYQEAHEAACELEHSTPDKVADRLDIYLDYPQANPEGATIPRSDCDARPERLLIPLSKMTAGQSGHFVSCQTDDDTRRFLSEQGLRAGAQFTIVAVTGEGQLIQLGEKRVALTRDLGEIIQVEPAGQSGPQIEVTDSHISSKQEPPMHTTQSNVVTTLPLSKLKTGQSGIVVRVAGKGPVKQRMMDMGLVPGSEVKVVRIAPLGDPIEFEVKGYRLSLRKSEAANISIELSEKESL